MAPHCPICRDQTSEVANTFCDAYGRLRFPGVQVHHYACRACGHGFLTHDLPLDRLYNLGMATPMDHGRDRRLAFIQAHLDLQRIAGDVIEIGGGPGELAEQSRQATGKSRASVVDFVSRVAFPDLDFVKLDLDKQADRLGDAFDTKAPNLILMSHVLEHLDDPSVLLAELRKFETSFVFIEVPDFGSPHTAPTLQWQMNGLEHVQYFNDVSLIRVLHDTGFQVLAFETQREPEMPVIRALCIARSAGLTPLEQSNALVGEIADRLRDRMLAEPAGREMWVWGLSPYMAEALTHSETARERVAGIVDNRFPGTKFAGLPVFTEPPAPETARPLIVCGSTYSVVQSAFRDKAERLWPDAEFFTAPLDDRGR